MFRAAGLSAGRGAAPGAESSPASDGADSAGTLMPNLPPPDCPAWCSVTAAQVNTHTQPAMLRASQEGKQGDVFIPACSFTRNEQAWSPGGRGGMKLRGKRE